MATVARLDVKIGADLSGFSSQMGKLQSQMKSVGTSLQSVGKKMSLAVTLPILGIGAAAIKTASDVEEMSSKFNTVFRDAARGVEKDLTAFADAAKRNRFELMGMAASLGDILVPMGYTRNEAAAMSVEMTKLGVDLSSFSNIPVADALMRIQGGLIGNHENLRIFGVSITEATLKQELMEMGADKLTGSMLEQAKIQARMNLLLKGTTDAQGDAIRTSESFANSFKGLQSQMAELGVLFGNIILPYATELVAKLTRLGKVVGEMSPSMKRLTIVVLGLAAALGPLLFILGGVASGIVAINRAILITLSLANPWVAAFAALAAVGAYVYLSFEKVRDVVNGTILSVRNLATTITSSLVETMKGAFAAAATASVGEWDAMWEIIKTTASEEIAKVAESVASFWMGVTPPSEGDMPVDPLGIGLMTAQADTWLTDLKGKFKSNLNGETDSAASEVNDLKDTIDLTGEHAPDFSIFLSKFTGGTDSVVSETNLARQAIDAIKTSANVLETLAPDFSNITSEADKVETNAEKARKKIEEMKDELIPDQLEMPEGLQDLIDGYTPSPDEVHRVTAFGTALASWGIPQIPESVMSKWKDMKDLTLELKDNTYNISRYFLDIRDSLDVLFGKKLGSWADKVTNVAVDVAKVVTGFESLIKLFEKETWDGIAKIIGDIWDLIKWVALAVWDWAFGQTAVNLASGAAAIPAGAGAAGAAGAGAGATGAGGGNGADAAGLLAVATVFFETGRRLLAPGTTLEDLGLTMEQFQQMLLETQGGRGFLGGVDLGATGLDWSYATGGISGRMAGGQTISIYLDGQVIANATLPYMANELELRGTNF